MKDFDVEKIKKMAGKENVNIAEEIKNSFEKGDKNFLNNNKLSDKQKAMLLKLMDDQDAAKNIIEQFLKEK